MTKEEEFFALPENPSFDHAIEFAAPTESVYDDLKKRLILLKEQRASFIIEGPLHERKAIQYVDVGELMGQVKKDIEDNFKDYTVEFSNEPLGFTYYLGNQLFFSNSVEIVQKIFHKERNDIGNLYYSLVIKFNEGKYYYWRW